MNGCVVKNPKKIISHPYQFIWLKSDLCLGCRIYIGIYLDIFAIFFSTVCIYIEMILYFLERTESVCFIVFMKCSQSVILCCMYVNFFHSDYARTFIFSENYEVTNNDLLHSVHLIIVFDNVQYVAVFKCYVVLLWKIIVYSRMFIKKLHILM